MAKYNLPKFSTSPTPASQQQPIIKLPNYAEIYARSFAYGQQAAANAFRHIRAEIEKIQTRKERDRLEKKANEERLLRKEENIARDATNYQQLIFQSITKGGAGAFEGELESMLMKNVDGFAANERAYKIEQTISAEDYNKMRAFYYKEINDIKISGEALKDSLDFDARNSESYSRYNNPEFPGLIKSLNDGEARLGRTKTGDLAIIYDDALDKEASFLVKDLKNLRAEDNINLKLNFSDESDIGYQSHIQLEKEVNGIGIINPEENIITSKDEINKIQRITSVSKFTNEQKEQAIKYIVNESPTMRNLMDPNTGVGGKYYLDNMLYVDELGETGADVRVNVLAKKYFKSKGIVPSAEEFKKVENLLETYSDELISNDPLQNEIKEFQNEQIKLDYAENLWNTKFASKEKELKVRNVNNRNITYEDETNTQKKLYADSLPAAISLGEDIRELAAFGGTEPGKLVNYTDTIKDKLNDFFGFEATSGVEYIETGAIGAATKKNPDIEIDAASYKLPEYIYGKNKIIQISPKTTASYLHSLRNILYGEWTATADIDIDKLIQGQNDYRLNKQTDAAKYYSERISEFGGTLPSVPVFPSNPFAGGTPGALPMPTSPPIFPPN